MSLRVTVHDDLAAVPADAWDALAAASRTATVFQTREWHQAWLDVHGDGGRLVLAAAHEAEQLVGLGAFHARADGLVRLVGHGRGDHVDLLHAAGRDDVAAALLDAALAAVPGWRRLELRHVPEASALPGLLVGRGLRVELVERVPAPTLLAGAEGVATFAAVARKKSLRRHLAWFRRQPGARVEHLAAATEIRPLLAAFFDQHVRRRAATAAPSLFTEASARAFYEALVDRLGPTGRLRFTRLAIDDRPVAFHLGFAFAGVLTWYKPAFEIELARHSPGEALLAELLALAEREGMRELDFTVGDEAFKDRFTNHVRHNLTLVVFRSVLGHAAFRTRRAARAALRPAVHLARRLVAGRR